MCYDGYTFRILTHTPIDTLSISSSNIQCIAEDPNRNMWIGTKHGISMLSRTDGHFHNYSIPDAQGKPTARHIYGIHINKRGQIWLKGIEALFLLDPKTDTIVAYPHKTNPRTVPTDLGNSPLMEDHRGRLWVGTKDGLYIFNQQNKQYQPIPIGNNLDEVNYRIASIYEDSRLNIWVGTDYGLFLIDTTQWRGKKYSTSNNLPINGLVNSISETSDSSILVGSDAGIAVITPDGTGQALTEVVLNGHIKKITNVNQVLIDRHKVLWVGMMEGLFKCNYFNQRFKSYAMDPEGNNLFGGNIIASMYQEPDGTYWVGTWGTGLYHFNPKNGKIKKYSTQTPERPIDNDFVHVIFKRKNGTMLLGTRNGVMAYNPATQQFQSVKPQTARGIFKNNRVYAIDEQPNGNLWFATINGLYCLQPNGKLRNYTTNAPDSMRIVSIEVRDVVVDRLGYIWVATGGGLNQLDSLGRVRRTFTKPKQLEHNSLLSNDLLCLHQDNDGEMWIGTANGLLKYDRSTETFIAPPEITTNSAGQVYAIEEDSMSCLWLTTNRGIVMLNPKTHFFRTFTTNDGLLSNECNLGASYRAKNGDIYIGTIAGINFFTPTEINVRHEQLKVALTRIELLGHKNEMTQLPVNVPEIKIVQGFKFLTIEFSAFDFNAPEKCRYRYKILGYDDKWVDLGTKHSIVFTNLKERSYELLLMGTSSDTEWNGEPLTLKIVVVAPFLRSKIAIAIYIILVVLITMEYITRRNRNLKRMNKIIKEREFVLNELEEQKNELQSTNKNLTDSINYAKRIQEAIIPSTHFFNMILPDSFILYMPKDIVSGDFYWINETQNKTFVAAVDCTGHGVPGAFMSIIGIELLRNITTLQGVNDASEILNLLSINIFDTFSSKMNAKASMVQDSMDVAFCVIDREYNTLQYAGAFSNLFLLRNGKIIEFSGDRYSVGSTSKEGNMLFSSYYIPLQPNDMIYMLTDGYVDQFGGVDGKKFKFRRFRQLLLNIYTLPFDQQRQHMHDAIVSWMGMHEQVDDILVIGIRPDLSCMF